MHSFTYRHSDLPSFRPEIQAEIVAQGISIDDLILKIQGNYLELKELAETLDNCRNTCELNLKSIQIIPDDYNPQPAQSLTLTDLPIQDQTMIFSTALFNAVALSTLQKITGADIGYLVGRISAQIDLELADLSQEQITASIKDYFAKYKEHPQQQAFWVKVATDI